ncbi:unnamed protein product [Calypogeia fissa]
MASMGLQSEERPPGGSPGVLLEDRNGDELHVNVIGSPRVRDIVRGLERTTSGEQSSPTKSASARVKGIVMGIERTTSSSRPTLEDHGKVCILSIDGGGMRGIIPGRVLAHLEAILKEKSGDPDAKIVDYFDIAAGTSVGGIIATMLFTDNGSGVPLFTGEESWKLIAEKGKNIFKIPASQRAWKKLRGILTPRYSTKYLVGILKEYLLRDDKPLTLRDTLKPVLIPCYDLESATPFVFSRADALTDDKWDFPLWEICRATSSVPAFFKPTLLKSVDGKTSCTAIDGGIVMNNPTAAAITHVLHNKDEFPNVRGTQDLLVLSLGTGQFDHTYSYQKVRHWGAFQWARPVVKIIFDGISDMVDHTVSMSFGEKNRCNYVRVQVSVKQVSGLPDKALMQMDNGSSNNVKRLKKIADEVITSPSMEHLPYGGRRNLDMTNEKRLELFAEQLVQERKARALRKHPTVVVKSGLPQAETPQPQAPQVQAPQAQAPQAQTPQSQAPQAKTLQIQIPEVQIPELQSPQAKTPQTKTPQAKTPPARASPARASPAKTPPAKTPQAQTPQAQTV